MNEMYDWNADDCPNLPSAHAVCNVMDGKPEGWAQVTKGTISRAGLIGVGIFLAGERDLGKLVAYSLAGATVIEAAVIKFIWTQRSTRSAQIGSPGTPTAVEFSEERSPVMYGAYHYDETHIREAMLPSLVPGYDATHTRNALLNQGPAEMWSTVSPSMSIMGLASATAVGYALAAGLQWWRGESIDLAAATPLASMYATGAFVASNWNDWDLLGTDVSIE